LSPLRIPSTELTPEVVFDPAENLLSIEGDCYPENPLAFYGPLLEVIQQHLATTAGERFFATFHLRYVNSASTKALARLLRSLDRHGQTGGRVLVRWEHEQEDEVGESLGRELTEELHHLDVLVRAVPAPA
jgi:hypothetical protein